MSARAAAIALGVGLAGAAVGCSDGSATGDGSDAPFPNRRTPFALPSGDFGLTSDNGSDTLSVLDLEALTTLGSAPVGRDPVDNDGPHHVALDPARGVVFTALAYPAPAFALGPHAAHGSSARAGYVQKFALDDLRPLGEVRVEDNPGDIVLSEDGSLLAVSHFDLLRATEHDELEARRASVALLNPNRLGAAADPAPAFVKTCIAPHGIALSRPSGERAFVACYGEDALAVVNTTDPTARPALVSVGPGGSPGRPLHGPYAAILSRDGAWVAVSNTLAQNVQLFSVADLEFREGSLPTNGTPYFPAWSLDDRVLYVPTQNPDGIEALAVESAERLGRRSFAEGECDLPHEAVFGSDGSMLYVVCEGDHVTPSVVLALDPSSFETLATLAVGAYPDRLAVARMPE